MKKHDFGHVFSGRKIEMIVTLKKAILHIIAPGIDNSVYSEHELDLTDGITNAFIISHIEKMYDNPTLRTGTFSQNSGFKYLMCQYREGKESFADMSKSIAKKLSDGISQGEVCLPSDIIVCECVISERNVIAVLKCDNKSAISHRTNGSTNEIISFHALLPTATQKLGECAFIDLHDLSIKFKGKSVTIDGERLNLMSEVLLECDSELSVSEAFSKVQKLAKKVSEEYGGDTAETDARIKQAVKETPADEDTVSVGKITETVFGAAPAAKAEFSEKLKAAAVPQEIERVEYITKRANKKIKIVTDTGIEILMPSELYRDGENMVMNPNEDGTYTIEINNIREIENKS